MIRYHFSVADFYHLQKSCSGTFQVHAADVRLIWMYLKEKYTQFHLAIKCVCFYLGLNLDRFITFNIDTSLLINFKIIV